MAVLVQTGGKIKITPTDYEQLINYTMLYDAGDECEEITGGWTSNGFSYTGLTIAAATKNANNIYSLGATNEINMLGTTNLIDLSEYTKVWQYGEAVGTYTSDNLVLSILNNKNMTYGIVYELTSWDTAGEIAVKSLDIEGGNYYVAVYSAGDANRSGKTYAVFLTKSDDINTLCSKAGISAPTSLDTLLADTTSLTAIFNSEDAVKFMVKQCTGDFMVGVLNSADAVALLKASPYLNTVVGNPHWAKFMMMIPTAKELLNYTMVYDEGDECTDVTGGWTQSGYNNHSGATNETATFGTDCISMSCTRTINHTCLCGTTNLIDTAQYSKMFSSIRAKTELGNCAIGLVDNKIFNSRTSLELTVDAYTNGAIPIGNHCDVAPINSKKPYYAFVRLYNDGVRTQSMDLLYMGLVKEDDWQTLCSKAGVTATSLEALVSDSTSMNKIMANEKAVKYLMGCTGDLMVSICNSETAMSALVNNIAYDYAFAHPVWYKFMTMIPTALNAMDSVAVTVPTMTSNTAPSGVVSTSSYFDSRYDAYKAFDGDASTRWLTANKVYQATLSYTFPEQIELYRIVMNEGSSEPNNTVATFEVLVKETDNGEEVKAGGVYTTDASYGTIDLILDTPVKAKTVTINSLTGRKDTTSIFGVSINVLQFYGKAVTK